MSAGRPGKGRGGALRIGFIGAGAIARHHAHLALTQVKGCELAAMADPSSAAIDKMRAYVSQFDPGSIQYYHDYRKMIAEQNLDAALILTPRRTALRGGNVRAGPPAALSHRDARGDQPEGAQRGTGHLRTSLGGDGGRGVSFRENRRAGPSAPRQSQRQENAGNKSLPQGKARRAQVGMSRRPRAEGREGFLRLAAAGSS